MRLIFKSLILISLVILTIQISVTTDCHYSCLTCLQKQFDKCLSCRSGYEYFVFMHQYYDSKNNQLVDVNYGLCTGFSMLEYNPLGIIMLLVFVFIFVIKENHKNNQAIFMVISWIQSFAMLSFLPLPFLQPLSFLLQSFSSFLFVTMISKAYKINQNSQYLQSNEYYRLQNFIRSDSIDKNILLIGIIVIIIVLYIILIPLFQNLRKCWNSQSSCRRCSSMALQKIQSACCICFYFLIQQSFMILFISLCLNRTALSIIFCVIYCSCLLFMVINYSFKPIGYFPTRLVQFLGVAEKGLLALGFMFLQDKGLFVCWIFGVLAVARLLGAFNNRAYKDFVNQKNKYFVYLILLIAVEAMVAAVIIVELVIGDQSLVKIISPIASIMICLLYIVILTTQIVQWIISYNQQKKLQQLKRNSFIQQVQTKVQINQDSPFKQNLELTQQNLKFSLQQNLSQILKHHQEENILDQNPRQQQTQIKFQTNIDNIEPIVQTINSIQRDEQKKIITQQKDQNKINQLIDQIQKPKKKKKRKKHTKKKNQIFQQEIHHDQNKSKQFDQFDQFNQFQ